MTLKEIKERISSSGLKKVYYRVNTKPATPPFAAYYIDSEKHSGSDSENLIVSQTLIVELYTAKKDVETEAALEAAFSDIPFEKYESYIPEEKLFMIAYHFDLYFKK